MDENNIGEILKRARLARGWDRIQAVKGAKLSLHHLSRIENGHLKPSRLLLKRMLDAYQVPEEDAQLLMRRGGYADEVDGRTDLSGTNDAENETISQVSNIQIDPIKTPVYYTNAVIVGSDSYGITIDAGQRLGTANQIQVIARIGFSLEHAIEIHRHLESHIKKLKKLRGIDN